MLACRVASLHDETTVSRPWCMNRDRPATTPIERRFTDRCCTTALFAGRSSDSGRCTRGAPLLLVLLDSARKEHLRWSTCVCAASAGRLGFLRIRHPRWDGGPEKAFLAVKLNTAGHVVTFVQVFTGLTEYRRELERRNANLQHLAWRFVYGLPFAFRRECRRARSWAAQFATRYLVL